MGVLSTVGGVQYHGGYHEYRWGYHEYRGGVQYRGDIMMHVRDIMGTVEGVQCHGGIPSFQI